MLQNKWISLAVILMSPLLTVVDVYIVNMALPAIRAQFTAIDSHTELVISSYLVGYCVFLITGGRAGDFFGRKKMFLWSMLAFTVSSAMCGLAETIWQLILFRFIQGVSAAFMVPQTLTMIQIAFREPNERARAFGYYGVTLGIASIIGQFLGGYFVASNFIEESWRLIFLINVPLGIITLVLAWFSLQETKQKNEERFDLSGVLLLTVSLSALIYSLTTIPEIGFSVTLVSLLLSAFLLLFFFGRNQHKKTIRQLNPLLTTSLFKIRSFNLILVIALFFWGAHNSYLLMCAIQFQRVLHIDALTASRYFSFNGLGFLISSLIAFRFLAKYGIKLLIGGGILMILSIVLQLLTLDSKENIFLIPFFMFIYGLGQGTLLPSILNYALKKIPVEHAAAAGGVYVTVQQFSSALGISVIGSIFFFAIRNNYNGYVIAMSMAAIYLIVVVLSLHRLSKFKEAH